MNEKHSNKDEKTLQWYCQQSQHFQETVNLKMPKLSTKRDKFEGKNAEEKVVLIK